MIGGFGIGLHPIAGEGEFGSITVTYKPVSRIATGGTFRQPGNVPELLFAWTWEDGTAITWEDRTPITLETL